MARSEGRVVAITKAGWGIGKEIAACFIAEGARVAINGRDPAKLEASAREIDPSGQRVAVSAGGIAGPAMGAALVDLAVSRFGKLDILVNNAGGFNPKLFLDLTDADCDCYLDTILKSKFFTAQAAAKAMKNMGGAIVQTGSMWAIQAIGATPSAANAGVHAMVRNRAIELARHNTRITAQAPAVVETPVHNTFPASDLASWITGTVLPVDGGVTAGRQ
ncbi:SDR family oxidoreductase [Breoghania sp. L-A4]|nr:SDR family oxidoreductase [Breoghania sp. L-A4]